MTHERDMERLLDHWFSDGPTEAPDRVIDVVADRIGRQRQRPAWRLDWRHATMTPTLKFGAAIAAVIIIGILGFGLFRGGDDSGVSPPAASPTSNPTVAPSLAPTPAPSATPSATVEAGVPGACDLMTADEAAQALHISYALEARSLIDLNIDDPAPFPSAICAYITGSTALVVLGYSKENGASTPSPSGSGRRRAKPCPGSVTVRSGLRLRQRSTS